MIEAPTIKKPTTVYVLEGLDGDLIAHAADGPLVFPFAEDGQNALGGPYKNYCLTSLDVQQRRGYGYTDYAAKIKDGTKPPTGGMWMRAFREMDNDAFMEFWQARHEEHVALESELKRAQALMDQKEWGRALAAFNAVLKRYPGNVAANVAAEEIDDILNPKVRPGQEQAAPASAPAPQPAAEASPKANGSPAPKRGKLTATLPELRQRCDELGIQYDGRSTRSSLQRKIDEKTKG